jgi:hypothetical protein
MPITTKTTAAAVAVFLYYRITVGIAHIEPVNLLL